jgi:hypothetical protein
MGRRAWRCKGMWLCWAEKDGRCWWLRDLHTHVCIVDSVAGEMEAVTDSTSQFVVGRCLHSGTSALCCKTSKQIMRTSMHHVLIISHVQTLHYLDVATCTARLSPSLPPRLRLSIKHEHLSIFHSRLPNLFFFLHAYPSPKDINLNHMIDSLLLPHLLSGGDPFLPPTTCLRITLLTTESALLFG